MNYTLTAQWQDQTATLPIASKDTLLACLAAYRTVAWHANNGELAWRFGTITLRREADGAVIALHDPEHGIRMAPGPNGTFAVVTPTIKYVGSLN